MVDESREYTDEEKAKLHELYNRRALARLCIYQVSTVDPSDPRREGALAGYNRQLAEIDKKIAAITGKIPPVVVNLKPAILFPRSEGITK